jgi:hypothetical protein
MTPTPRPNELANQVEPNKLSVGGHLAPVDTTGTARSRPADPARPQANVAARPVPGVSPLPTPRPASPSIPSIPPAGQPGTARRSRGGPGLSLLIFAGVIIYNLLRWFGSSGGTVPTTPPGAAAPPTATEVPLSATGPVDFGTSQLADCAVGGRSTEFSVGAKVWWSAHFAMRQEPEATVLWLLKRDHVVLGQGKGPSEPPPESWTGLCAGEAITADRAGLYRFEVWETSRTRVLAAGEFRVTLAGPSRSPSTSPSASPWASP